MAQLAAAKRHRSARTLAGLGVAYRRHAFKNPLAESHTRQQVACFADPCSDQQAECLGAYRALKARAIDDSGGG